MGPLRMSYPNTDARHLRGPVTVSLLGAIVSVAVATVLAALTAGAAEARAILVGAVVVAGFFGIGLLVMSAALRFRPGAALPLALMTYVLQMAVVTLAFVAMDRSGVLDRSVDAIWLTVTVAVLTVLFTAGLMWWAMRVRVPVYDLDDPHGAAREDASPGSSSSASGPLLRVAHGTVQGLPRGWEASAR